MNVMDEQSVADGFHATVVRYGGLDVLVSNAGVLRAGAVTSQPLEEFDLVTRVNYRGYFLGVRSAAPIMARQHRAKPDYRSDIIEINSKSGLVGSSRNSAYAGSKFGGIGLTQSFALELVDDGVKVNAICPGNFFDGPLWADPENGLFVQYLRAGKVPGATTIDDVRHFYEAKVPMGRGCTPADVLVLDIRLPGMLYGAVLRSPHAHAKILSIDTSQAEKLHGVHAVITAKDFPDLESKIVELGEGVVNRRYQSNNVLARDKVLYFGHAVAGVSATSLNVAKEALDLIRVEYEVLSPVLDVRKAMESASPVSQRNQPCECLMR